MSTSEETVAGETGATHAEFQEQTRAHRLEKLERLRERGVEPYPVRFDRDATAAALHEQFGELAAGADTHKLVRLAGRLMGERRHGGLDFAELQDETGAIQLLITRDVVGSEVLHDFSELDLGDWIGVEGTVIVSDHGELSVRLASFELLSKSLRALPDVRHGLTDAETRYRQRYLDLILDEPARRIFTIRSAVIAATRRVLIEQGFREVETPVLLGQAGGAAAKPFVTHHNALDIDMTLRIALELPLKRLIVGGMNRVFEIGRVFRNEGLDTRHNPEFTLLEAYQAFGDYHDMMELTEAIVATAAQEAIGTTLVTIKGQQVDLKPPWRRVTMIELIKQNVGVEMHPSMPVEDARKIAEEIGVQWLDAWGSGKIISEVYDESSEAKLIEPTFVLDHPREVSPLARAHRDDPALTERFEMVVAGRELANAYSELNDPVDQAARFAAEAKLQAGGDEEAEPVDDDYVRALEYGLPARTLDEFLSYCSERGWRVAFFAVREADAEIYRARGMHTIYLGDEAIVHCDEFSLDGAAMKAARSAVRRIAREHSFELIAETEASPALIAELNEISAEWRAGAPERGFTMELGEDVEGKQADFVIAVAREHGGRVAGFLRFVPVYGERPGYSLDLMRRRPGSANGVTEYLIAEAALALGARGFKRLSLNFAAWGRLLDSAEDAGLSGRLQRLFAKGLNPFFQIQSLRDFNQKFAPEWVPRSVVIDDVSDLPRVALLYASVEGFLEIPLLSRVLEPPIRQRVEAAQAAQRSL